MNTFEVTYHLDADAAAAPDLAESVLLEQTVETPASVARRVPFVRTQMMGSIRELLPADESGYRVKLSLSSVTASIEPAQFLNVLFGNVSLHASVRLVDFELPDAVRALFTGPRFGVNGWREATGVADRPLMASALKPVGLSLQATIDLCRTLAEGRVDIIKDDHYLSDHSFCPFEQRVRGCLDAVEEVAARTGHRTVYVPNLSGPPDTVRRQAAFAQEAGAPAVLVAPMLLGLPFFQELVTTELSVPVLAHPSFAGSTRIAPATLFGKLFRLFGADAVIFANYGGRFSYSQAVCGAIADQLRAPWRDLAPALPVPAGGMQVGRAVELVEFFGRDVMLLIGGSLLEAGDDLRDRTRALTERVARAAITLNHL